MTKARDNANGGLGLILIKPSSVVNGTDNGKGVISVSGVTSVSLNGVFKSAFDNYKIIINGSAGDTSSLRLRANGSDNSNSNYTHYHTFGTSDSGAQSPSYTDSRTDFLFGEFGNSGSSIILEISQPFLATPTSLHWSNTNLRTNAPGKTRSRYGNAGHSESVSYDGFTFICGSNLTCSISVYGYTK